MSARAASSPRSPRARSATVAPSSANRRADARPMPPDAPVTTTTRGLPLLTSATVGPPPLVDVPLDLGLRARGPGIGELVLRVLHHVLELRARGAALDVVEEAAVQARGAS